LALSAACPIWRGFLSDIDCRWNVLSQAADDRTVEEQQRPNLSSRYGSTPLYLGDQNNHLNDVEIDVDEEIISTLIDHGRCFNQK
jgi:glutamate--cysteine ligase catalytic subunit